MNTELGELQEHLEGLPRELPVVTICAAGMRATTSSETARTTCEDWPGSGASDWTDRGYPTATDEE